MFSLNIFKIISCCNNTEEKHFWKYRVKDKILVTSLFHSQCFLSFEYKYSCISYIKFIIWNYFKNGQVLKSVYLGEMFNQLPHKTAFWRTKDI